MLAWEASIAASKEYARRHARESNRWRRLAQRMTLDRLGEWDLSYETPG